ncbi:hypothetical protein [Herbaspirillum rhizosphaerae]|uniref:hypothetical protein n=1 Tax=Herbaspirillum rhizosphaerae TaxID=346179 RepID=UPI000AD2B4EE|nr:hypothetical protein [Herbaspirillum rhizosphaerae]
MTVDKNAPLLRKSTRSLLKNIALLSALAVVATGCVTVNKQPLAASNIPAIKDQSMAPTTRDKPSFVAMTAGKAAFALFGTFAMIAEGNQIVEKNQIDDPANAIASALTSSLSEKYGAKAIPAPIAVNSEDAAQISASAKDKARYVVDVQTVGWGFGYFPTDWSHYRVFYNAKARLIDAQSKSLIAEGFCKRFPTEQEGAPTYDELMANQATLLKEKLSSAMSECVTALQTEMFPQ